MQCGIRNLLLKRRSSSSEFSVIIILIGTCCTGVHLPPPHTTKGADSHFRLPHRVGALLWLVVGLLLLVGWSLCGFSRWQPYGPQETAKWRPTKGWSVASFRARMWIEGMCVVLLSLPYYALQSALSVRCALLVLMLYGEKLLAEIVVPRL